MVMAELLEQPSAVDSGVHYDISPLIFELLLDRNLNYSSGCYDSGEEDLDRAQEIKMRRVAALLDMRAGKHILDVGCGWGGPLLYFAEHFDCHVTGITLSKVQQQYILDWAARRKLQDRVQVQVRNVMEMDFAQASFDGIYFFESIIHMPDKAHIFERCHRLLKPGGRILVQESNYDRASMRERYLSDRGFQQVNRAFGDSGDLVSTAEMLLLMEEAQLVPQYVNNISQDYVRTLSQWLQKLDQNAAAMRSADQHAYTMLRRYLMIALQTYRSGGTVCCQMVAHKSG